MKVLCVTTGSDGDLNPFLAIGRELASRGHQVGVIADARFHRRVIASRLGFFAHDSAADPLHFRDLSKMVEQNRQIRMAERLADGAIHRVATIETAFAAFRPDVVVRHAACFGTRWACERHNVPCAVAALAPGFSAADWATSRSPAVRRLQRGGASLAFRLLTTVLGHRVGKRLQQVQRRLGFPAEADVIHLELTAGILNLGMWPRIFRPLRPEDSSNTVICGFPWLEPHSTASAMSRELQEFLDESPGDNPIVFTLGSLTKFLTTEFAAWSIEACRRLRRRGVVLLGSPVQSRTGDPPGIKVLESAPLSMLLPRAAAVVHAGGSGWTARTLRAGRPALILPSSFQQQINALNARRLGVAAVVPWRRVNLKAMIQALDRVLGDSEMARCAAAIAPQIADEDGARSASDALEQAVGWSSSRANPSALARVERWRHGQRLEDPDATT